MPLREETGFALPWFDLHIGDAELEQGSEP
jgi:hypothetical protein